MPNYKPALTTSSTTKKLDCNDKLVISPNTTTNRIVKDKLDYYLRDIREHVSDSRARQKLLNMIMPIRQQIMKEIAINDMKLGTDSKKGKLMFKYKTMKDFNDKIKELNEDEYGICTPNWSAFTTQIVDYLANPKIIIKNEDVVNRLLYEQMESLGASPDFFVDVQQRIAQLRDEVYILPPKPPSKPRSDSPSKRKADENNNKRIDGILTKDHDSWKKYFDEISEKYAGADILIRP